MASNSFNDSQFQCKTHKSNSIEYFLSTVGKSQSRVKSSITPLQIADELAAYRSLAMREYNDIVEQGKKHNVFSFWHCHQGQLTFLTTLARKHLITPATSESAFSVASFLGCKERNRLNPHNLAQLVFLKDNMEQGN
jgi:hypothetical protein